MSSRRLASLLAAFFPVFSLALWGSSPALGAPESQEFPPASKTVLRVAHSPDGLTFEDTGEVFMEHAAAPDLEFIGGERVMAVFDSQEDGSESASLNVSRSNDNGKTWSPRRALRIKGLRDDRVQVGHGDLVRVGRGSWRLYFAARYSERGSSRRTMHMIQSATTRNGADYVLDRGVRLRANTKGEPHPMAVSFGKRVHLYYKEGRRASSDKGRNSEVRHMISRRGDRFASLRSVDVSGASFAGTVLRLPKGMRAYLSSGEGIVSYVTADGREWAREPGVRLQRGWDPAVTRLADGSYLMLYCDALEEAADTQDALVEAPIEEPDDWQLLYPDDYEAVDDSDPALVDAEVAAAEEAEFAAIDAQNDQEGSLDEAEAEYQVALGENDEVPVEDVEADYQIALGENDDSPVEDEGRGESTGTVDSAREETAEDAPIGEGERLLLDEFDAPSDDGSHWMDNWDEESSDGFAPTPDFETKVDYVEWLRDFGTGQPEENAYDAYAEITGGADAQPEWPELNDMFHGDNDGPPAPWRADDHPEWETSNRAMQDLLGKFREATEMADYAMPIEFSEKDKENAPGGQPLLIGLRLPHLSRHRRLSRASLAAAWRVGDDGKVSSKRMLEAWRTTLRGAAHLNQGATLIEDLVGIAERRQVHDTARWALRRGVFGDGDFEAALNTLRQNDSARPAMPKAMRGEHAFAMDAVQFMFAPRKRGDEPQPRRDRIDSLLDDSWLGDAEEGERDAVVDRVAAMSASDVHDTIDAFNTHYRELEAQMRIGYPDVRRADVDAVAERYLHRTPVTEFFLPTLGRAYMLQARYEASRRATQLAYATHIFKAENGRWPASLAELPAELGETMRIDPFSGESFGYRVTEEGPVIYTVSENGVDDGGVHSPKWDDEPDEATGSDDFVFWPPQPK